MERERTASANADEIFNNILGTTASVSNSIKVEKEKNVAKMVHLSNPNIDVDDWNKEMKEIHKYVESKEEGLKSEWYYCTCHGKAKGMLTIKEGIIVFDPLQSEENKKFEDLSKFHCYIDFKDICDVQIIKLPNESAQYIQSEKDRQWYIYDYYLQFALSTVDGETLNKLLSLENRK